MVTIVTRTAVVELNTHPNTYFEVVFCCWLHSLRLSFNINTTIAYLTALLFFLLLKILKL